MIPSPDRFSGGNDMGGSSGGGPRRLPPAGSGDFDDILIGELGRFHQELCPVVKLWMTKKPSLEALEKLVELSDRLFNMIYSRYRYGEEADGGSVILLKKLADKIRLAAFGLNDMWEAGRKISPEDRLSLHDRLLELDSALELVLGISEG
jgi:hypothetical protein